MAAGRTIEQLLADFPYIEEPDIREALAFAHAWLRGTRSGSRVDAPAYRYEPDASLGRPPPGRGTRSGPLVIGRFPFRQGW
ncbi:MAG: DUF433 domain-containing protein [Bryobacteraceae bacterium]